MRAVWSGHLVVSLVAVPVRLYAAVSRAGRVELHLLHRGCGERIHYQPVCPVHGPVERSELVRGYEYEPGRHVVLDDEALASIRLRTTRVLEVEGFVAAGSIDEVYHETPYYLMPDGPVAATAYAVLREALARTRSEALGRVTFGGHEHTVLVGPHGRGLRVLTLRPHQAVVAEETVFAELPEARVDPEALRLAERLVSERRTTPDPSRFRDRYEEALLELVQARLAGRAPEAQPESETARVVDFLEALKRSLEGGERPRKRAPAPSLAGRGATATARRRRGGRQRGA